jgi:hypothetical protein
MVDVNVVPTFALSEPLAGCVFVGQSYQSEPLVITLLFAMATAEGEMPVPPRACST